MLHSTSNADRSLAVRHLPRAGEALDSWLDHNASLFSIGRAQLISAFGLPLQLLRPRESLGTRLTDPEVGELARVLRVGRLEVDSLIQPTRVLEHLATRTRSGLSYRELGPRAFSPYCALCLHEGSGWLVEWRNPWIGSCTRHGVTLRTTCPSCGGAPRSQQSRAQDFAVEEAICGYRADIAYKKTPVCIRRLDLVQMKTARDEPLAALNHIAEHSEALRAGVVADDVRALLRVTRRNDVDASSSDMIAAVVAAALGHTSSLQLIERCTPLRERKSLPAELNHASPSLRRRFVEETGRAIKPVAQLRTPTHGAQMTTRTTHSFDPERTAQFLPSAHFPSVVGKCIRKFGTSVVLTPGALAMATVMLGNRTPEDQCAQLLGMPNYDGRAGALLSAIPVRSRWEWLEELADVAKICHDGGIPIDYSRRRSIRNDDLLNQNEWDLVCLLGGSPIRVDTLELAQALSALIFRGSYAFADEVRRPVWRLLRWLPSSTFFRLVQHLDQRVADLGFDEPLAFDLEITTDSAFDGAAEIRRRFAARQNPTDIARQLRSSRESLLTTLVLGARPDSVGHGRVRGAVPTELSVTDIRNLHADGETARRLGNAWGMGRHRVAKILHHLDLDTPCKRPTHLIDDDWLRERYQAATLNEIAAETGASATTISLRLRRLRVPARIGGAAHAVALRAADYPQPLRSAVTGQGAAQRIERLAIVAKAGSFRAASQTNGWHACTVREQVRRLERDVGETLLDKSQGRFRLTPKAKQLVTQASRFL